VVPHIAVIQGHETVACDTSSCGAFNVSVSILQIGPFLGTANRDESPRPRKSIL
jgi:hypothetical protein